MPCCFNFVACLTRVKLDFVTVSNSSSQSKIIDERDMVYVEGSMFQNIDHEAFVLAVSVNHNYSRNNVTNTVKH